MSPMLFEIFAEDKFKENKSFLTFKKHNFFVKVTTNINQNINE